MLLLQELLQLVLLLLVLLLLLLVVVLLLLLLLLVVVVVLLLVILLPFSLAGCLSLVNGPMLLLALLTTLPLHAPQPSLVIPPAPFPTLIPVIMYPCLKSDLILFISPLMSFLLRGLVLGVAAKTSWYSPSLQSGRANSKLVTDTNGKRGRYHYRK